MRRVQKAHQAAEKLLREHGALEEGVDVYALARQYADVVEKSLGTDLSGALIPVEGAGWVILVNADHSIVRRRFTVAHELGHLILHSYTGAHADRTFKFRDWRSSEGSAAEEIEANQFAAELLMPRALVLSATRSSILQYAPEDNDDAFERLVADLAQRFQVSRQAMTIRLSALLA